MWKHRRPLAFFGSAGLVGGGLGYLLTQGPESAPIPEYRPPSHSAPASPSPNASGEKFSCDRIEVARTSGHLVINALTHGTVPATAQLEYFVDLDDRRDERGLGAPGATSAAIADGRPNYAEGHFVLPGSGTWIRCEDSWYS
jgi:hypothetical protein